MGTSKDRRRGGRGGKQGGEAIGNHDKLECWRERKRSALLRRVSSHSGPSPDSEIYLGLFPFLVPLLRARHGASIAV